MRALFVAVAILSGACCAAFAQGEGQGEWQTTPVVSELWLGGAEPVDQWAAPGIVINREGLVYIAFSLRGGEWRYYTKDHPASRGTFSGFSPLFSPQGSAPASGLSSNLLALDSLSTLHYITSYETPETCLQYAANRLNDTILTSFNYLENVGPGACGAAPIGASVAADAAGNIHLAGTVGNHVFYFRRSGGIWSEGVRISDSVEESFSPSIAVTPSGQVHILYLSHPLSPGQETYLNYVSGSGNVFGEPTVISGGRGESVNRGALVVDAEGVCHAVWTDITNMQMTALYYGVNRGGIWKSEVVLGSLLYETTLPSVAVDHYGGAHIVGGYSALHPDSVRDDNLYYMHNAGSGWSAPVRITENGVRDVAYNRGNGFIALRDSILAVVYTSIAPGDKASIMLSQRTIGFDPVTAVESDTIDLGTRYADADGWTIDTTISIRNGGAPLYRALRLGNVTLIDAQPAALTFTSADVPGDIRGGDAALLPVTLKGSLTGPFSLRIAIESNGGADTVVLTGRVRKPAAVARTLQLGSDTIEVGSLASVSCTVDPPLAETDGVQSLSIRIHFPARSLFPRRVVPADLNASATLTSSYDGAGTLSITVTGKNGRPLAGRRLFTVELEGLLTGEFVNDVTPVVDSIPEVFNPELVAGHVYLYGCEVGTDVHFGKAGFAGRIAPNPVRDVLSFDYVAPDEVPVSVYLMDLLGTEHLATTLPAGTGEPQEAGIQLGTLPPGLYFVRLRVGERVVTDLMIKE